MTVKSTNKTDAIMALAGDLQQITATKLPNNRITIKVMPLTAAQPPN